MKKKYEVIPFFEYHEGGFEDDDRKLVSFSRLLRSRKDGEPNIIQKLWTSDGRLPSIEHGSRCICFKTDSREATEEEWYKLDGGCYTETGEKVPLVLENYELLCVLPNEVMLQWDNRRKEYSGYLTVGKQQLKYVPSRQPDKRLPAKGSSAKVKWQVKPFIVVIFLPPQRFVIGCELVKEIELKPKNRDKFDAGRIKVSQR